MFVHMEQVVVKLLLCYGIVTNINARRVGTSAISNGIPFYSLTAANAYGVIMQLVNTAAHTATATISSKNKSTVLNNPESDLPETNKRTLPDNFPVPGKGIIMIRVAQKTRL